MRAQNVTRKNKHEILIIFKSIAYVSENALTTQVTLFLVCTTYASPIIIIIAIVAAIVGIGLAILLIWKLLTSIKDAREFKNFQKESANAKWQAVSSRMFFLYITQNSVLGMRV